MSDCCDPCDQFGNITPPSFNRPPSTVGPFPEKGEVVLFYKSLLGPNYKPVLTFKDPSGTSKEIPIPTLGSGDKVVVKNTGIIVEAGQSIQLVSSREQSQGDAACPAYIQEPNTKYYSLGWKLPSGGMCGTDMPGPPTGGEQNPYEPVSVSAEISWASNYPDVGDVVQNGSQCWADWMEWPGDYDFNDYFLQISYEPIAEPVIEPSCGDGEKNGDEVCDPSDPENNTCVNNLGQTVGCGTDCTCPVVEPSCGDGEKNGNEVCDPSDPENNTCVNNLGDTVACNNDCTCPVAVETNPDWTITKDATSEYISINDETFGRVDYTVVVTNVGDGDGSIDKIIDELDEKVLESYIQEISNNGVFASGSITWDLQGDDEIFSPEESLQLTYGIEIPESAFGTYRNLVTAYPREGDNFSDDATVTFQADEEEVIVEEPPEIPQTGIFDTVLGRVSVGVSFIFLGGLVTQYSKINYVFNSISERREFRVEIRKQKRVNKRRNSLESRFKDD
jgi:hypothetical protein